MVRLNIRVSLEDSRVVAEAKDHLNQFEEEEIDQRNSASQVLLVAQLVSELRHTLKRLGNAGFLLIFLEGRTQEAHHVLLEEALELDNSASFHGVCTHESRCPPVTDVHGHGRRLCQLEVTVDDVRQVRIVKTQVLLVLPAFSPLVISAIVAPVLEVNSSVAQNVTIDVAAIANSEPPVG